MKKPYRVDCQVYWDGEPPKWERSDRRFATRFGARWWIGRMRAETRLFRIALPWVTRGLRTDYRVVEE